MIEGTLSLLFFVSLKSSLRYLVVNLGKAIFIIFDLLIYKYGSPFKTRCLGTETGSPANQT
jgi:hypothetical protein